MAERKLKIDQLMADVMSRVTKEELVDTGYQKSRTTASATSSSAKKSWV